ncbi:MAG: tetratricopeptide repeat protein [Bacteroidales bacterium]
MDKNLKTEALKEIKKGDFITLFEKVDQLDFEDWLNFLLPKNPNSKQINGKIHFKRKFWVELTKSNHFNALLKSDKVNLLFDYYFSKENNADEAFNKAVINIDTQLFIYQYKSSKFKIVFNDSFTESIKPLVDSEEKDLKLFTEFVIYLNEIEKDLWNQFISLSKIWLELNPLQMLAFSAFYFELNHEKKVTFYSTLNHLYSYYFYENRNKPYIKNSISESKDYVNEALEMCISDKKNKYFESIEKLHQWSYFVYDVSSLFLFTDNYFLSETKYHYHLNCSDTVKKAKWKTDGHKIEYLPVFIEYLFSKIGEPGYKNTSTTTKDKAISNILSFMNYTYYEFSNLKIPVDEVAKVFDNLILTAKKNIKAIEFDSEDNFIKAIKTITNNNQTSQEIKRIMCFNPNDYQFPNNFNRFIPFVNIVAQPFFDFGDQIINLENFLKLFPNSFNMIRENVYYHESKKNQSLPILRPDKLTKAEDKLFEKHLAEVISSIINFKTVIYSKEIKSIGEVDLLISHDDTILIIELKRTHFRKQLSEINYEQEKINKHASDQLNKIIRFLKDEENYIWILENLKIDVKNIIKILPLIVTTSMEQDGEKINGILKTNFYDFLYLVWNIKKEASNILENIYNEIEKDTIWKNFENERKISVPIQKIYEEPQYGLNYRHSFLKKGYVPDNIPDDENENKQFETGNYFFEQKDYNNAIIHFQRAHEINPYEASYIDLIATCLAEMGQKETAMQLYDKALKLRKDLRIWQNMFVTAKEISTK